MKILFLTRAGAIVQKRNATGTMINCGFTIEDLRGRVDTPHSIEILPHSRRFGAN